MTVRPDAPESRFFRCSAALDVLRRNAIPRILDVMGSDDVIRVWVIGCAAGEEAYTIAMVVQEALSEHRAEPMFKVFATDADRAMIARASAGVYALGGEENLDPGRLARYFIKSRHGLRIAHGLRERVRFAVHDFHTDPPFSGMNLVCGRNLRALVRRGGEGKALSHIRHAMWPHSVLFLGQPGLLGDLSEEFSVLDDDCGIYQRRQRASRIGVDNVLGREDGAARTPAGSTENFRSAAEADEIYTAVTQELTELNDDMENLLASIDTGTVFLDRELRIRKFTPAAVHAFSLHEHDTGRPFADVSHRLVGEDPSESVEYVARTGVAVKKEVVNTEGMHLHMRVRPYETEDERNAGVVITLVDVTDIHRTQQALRGSEERLRSITENSRDVFWMVRPDTLEVLYISKAYETVWGQSMENLYRDGMQRLSAIHPEDRDRAMMHYRTDVEKGTYDIKYRIVRPDGKTRWVHDRVFPVVDGDRVTRIAGVAIDITENVDAEVARESALEMFKGAFDDTGVGMFLAEENGELTRANKALCELLGRDATAVLEHDVFGIVHPEDRSIVSQSLGRVFAAETRVSECECRLLAKGSNVWVRFVAAAAANSAGPPTHIVGHIQDISAERAEESRMRKITTTLESEANNDPLTALLNRRGLEKILRTQITQARRSGTNLVAVLVDCDNFKQVNDGHGHAAGDAVLREVACRLSSTLRPSDLVARIGGDEFLLLLPDTRIAEGLHVAEKLRRCISEQPVSTREGSHRITASFGAAAVSQDVSTIEAILRCTHDALARSKLRGKNRVHGSAEHVRPTRAGERAAELVDVRSGEGFRTVVQPIWDLGENTVIGFEMLSRGPTGPLEKPADLFQLCTDTRVLTEVDLLCLNRAVRGAGRLEADRRVHVNLFPSTILEAELEELIALFRGTGTPERFCLEVSEQQVVGDPALLLERTSKLKSHGIEIAVDDVGFGRSSLETLIVLEPDVIKIDRSMVTGVSSEPGLKRSLDRLMQISRGLDARLIAEGIETREDRLTLLDMGVAAGQGFLWGRPYHLV